MEAFTETNDNLEKLIDKSILLDNENGTKEDDSKKKKLYLKNSLSEEYILQYIREEVPFTRAVRRGLEEHIEDLMTRLYHYENHDEEEEEKETESDIDKISVESDLSIHSIEL